MNILSIKICLSRLNSFVLTCQYHVEQQFKRLRKNNDFLLLSNFFLIGPLEPLSFGAGSYPPPLPTPWITGPIGEFII